MGDAAAVLSGMFLAAQTSAVLTAAIELGLFATLASGALTAEELAKKAQTPVRSTRILLDALLVLDPPMLMRTGSQYRLTDLARDHLVPGRPRYLGSFALSPAMLEGLARLADAVKNDGTVLGRHALTPQNPHWEKSARASDDFTLTWTARLADWLAPWIKTRATLRVLDVACGGGANGFALATKHPMGHVTLLDQPNVLGSTRATQGRFGMPDDRVTHLPGDLLKLDFGGPFDIVLLSHILHFFDSATCQGIARKAADALAPDGILVIHERLVTDVGSEDAVMFSVEMLSWSPTGEAYTKKNYDEWFRVAGLGRSEASPAYPDQFVRYER